MVGKLAFSIASLVGEKTEAQKISSPDNNAEDNVTVKRKNGGETSDESGTVDQTVGDSPLASTANVMIEQQNETWKRLQQAFSLGVKDSTTMPFNGFPGLFAGQQQQSGPNILDPFRTTPNQWIEFVQKNLAVTSLYARLSQQQQVPQTSGPHPFLPVSLLSPGAHSASRNHHIGAGHLTTMGNGVGQGHGHGAFFSFRKPKRIRTAFSPSQLLHLEHSFDRNHYVVGTERKDLAKSLGLSETQVKVWFQNRRTKYKRHKTDEESRKRCPGGSGGSLPSSSSDSISSMTHIILPQQASHSNASCSSSTRFANQQHTSNLQNNNVNSSIDYRLYGMGDAGAASSEVESVVDSASSIDGEDFDVQEKIFSMNSSSSVVFDVSKHTKVQ